MPNDWFQFKQFRIDQQRAAFKVGTDGVLLGAWAPVEAATNILDIGAGTGLIALMLAQRNTTAAITAIEPDEPSFQDAFANAQNSTWSDRIAVRNWSLQTLALQHIHEPPYDLIVSNPPFFASSLPNTDPRKTAARHEAALPLLLLLKQTRSMITPDGALCLVLPIERRRDFVQATESLDWHEHQCIWIKPTTAKKPNRFLTRLCPMPSTCKVEYMTLHEQPGVYSNAALHLLRPFYLKL